MIWLLSATSLTLLFLFLRARRALNTQHKKQVQHLDQQQDLLKDQDRAHQREIKRLLDSLPYAFFSINQQGKIIRTNHISQQIFKGRHILQRSIRQVFFDAPIVAEIEKNLTKPSPRSRNLRLPPNSTFSEGHHGKESHWELTLQPLSIKNDALEIQVMMRDISAHSHAEQIRQDFVANASHELRTPLAIISGYLENLTEKEGLSDLTLAKKMLGTMDRHVIRINRIVEEMLLIAKLDSGTAAPLNISTFQLRDCLYDIIERLESVIEKQGAIILPHIPDLSMSGDAFYWTQILSNLIENALKQNTHSPVTISINAQQDEQGEISITVTDNGIGIPSPDIPFIFKRFFRVEKHHSQQQVKGTGLGLSIVKRAVEAHGGSISAQSTPGVETTFTIKVPQDSSRVS